MGRVTTIEWTHHTFNPWLGCSKVAPGCKNCYAESLVKRFNKAAWGPNGTRVKTSDSYWKQPLKWNREAEKAGERRRVFCASLADVFEDWQGPIMEGGGRGELAINAAGAVWPSGYPSLMPDADDWGIRELTMNDLRRELFALIDATPHLDWLLLTKRPENVRRMWPSHRDYPECAGTSCIHNWRRNVWLGTSISDQATADEWIPRLLQLRDLAPVLFLSAEPLLGPVNIERYLWAVGASTAGPYRYPSGRIVRSGGIGGQLISRVPANEINWVIVGGESGPGARPCDIAWIRSIVEQCQAAGVPVFVKQLGSRLTVPNDTAMEWPLQGDEWVYHADDGPVYQGMPVTLRLNDKGGDIDEWPADLRIRQFPKL